MLLHGLQLRLQGRQRLLHAALQELLEAQEVLGITVIIISSGSICLNIGSSIHSSIGMMFIDSIVIKYYYYYY